MLKRFLILISVLVNFLLIIVAFTPIANRLGESLYVRPYLMTSDLIVVLGGGAYENGVLTRASMERLIHGLMLYRQGYASRIAFVGGTIRSRPEKVVHTLSGSETGEAIDVVESEIMAKISDTLGIPPSMFFVERESTNTYTNLEAVKSYMEDNKLSTCLIVTSPTHILRAMEVSRKLGLECYPAPVDNYIPYRDSPEDRISLMAEVLWEFVALKVYRIYGYI